MVFADRNLERNAVDRWLRRSRDQRLSLADVVSFEVMRLRRIRQVLALDEHFELAGFEPVPEHAGGDTGRGCAPRPAM